MPATEASFKQRGLPASLSWFVISFEIVIAAPFILGVGAATVCDQPVCPMGFAPVIEIFLGAGAFRLPVPDGCSFRVYIPINDQPIDPLAPETG
jgi:hypothetical protein